MINLGIDLGTTNSAIAHYESGRVTIFNNPRDFGRYTLPSVVAFRKDRLLIGAKAREWQEKDAANVFSRFKRKMGTSETWTVPINGETTSPIDLSAQILRELKSFLPEDISSESVVVTIPAAFDTIQSNATKEAGLRAGFQEVVLLQEPIAASLAYANQQINKTLPNGKWLVFDLGGGTFDVALLEIKDGEMKVLDHEGDNFLGGTDFDRLIVDNLILPELEKSYKFGDLEKSMKSASGKYNTAYHVLLRRAEDAKIQLSGAPNAELFVDGFEDDEGNDVEKELLIKQSDFNQIITPHVEHSLDLLRQILERNDLTKDHLQFILLVGGSTYIPYVRQRLNEAFGIPLNVNIDPTTCVAMGAAFYAGTRRKQRATKAIDNQSLNNDLGQKVSIRASYPASTQEKEIWFAAKITGASDAMQYRLTREDGGFDSGLKNISNTIGEALPLVPNQTNYFKLQIVDPQLGNVASDLQEFSIACGYSISGQPLPQDISLEIDDPQNPGNTKLMLIFPRNATLPLKKTIIRTLNANLNAGNATQNIKINILEGPSGAAPESNRKIGYFEVSGESLNRNVLKGSDIEISIRMTESRDLFISAYVTMAEQDFEKTFNPTQRHTTVDMLRIESSRLLRETKKLHTAALEREDYNKAGAIHKILTDVEAMQSEVASLSEDDTTDLRYQMEDKRCRLAQKLDELTNNDRLLDAWKDYEERKEQCEQFLEDTEDHQLTVRFNDIIADAQKLFAAGMVLRIQSKTKELDDLAGKLWMKSPSFLIALFTYVCNKKMEMSNQAMADTLEETGRRSLMDRNWKMLANVSGQMFSMLPESQRGGGVEVMPEKLRKNVGF
jgi:molecular chaperone DnaK